MSLFSAFNMILKVGEINLLRQVKSFLNDSFSSVTYFGKIKVLTEYWNVC